jgi:hypothetical protein
VFKRGDRRRRKVLKKCKTGFKGPDFVFCQKRFALCAMPCYGGLRHRAKYEILKPVF